MSTGNGTTEERIAASRKAGVRRWEKLYMETYGQCEDVADLTRRVRAHEFTTVKDAVDALWQRVMPHRRTVESP